MVPNHSTDTMASFGLVSLGKETQKGDKNLQQSLLFNLHP